jgi:drug/metabolite transporter (DMT)-like permease
MNRRGSLIAVVVSAACFGTLAVLAPLAYDAGALPLPLLAWRFMFAALLLAGLVAARKPSDLRVSRSDFARYAVLALTGYGAASICFFFALTYADASVVAVLLYAYPALVTIASWLFLGERPTWQRGLAVVMTFVGCALVVGLLGGPVEVSVPGVLLGLGAAVGYTLFNLLSDRWLPGRSQLVMMGYTFGIAAIGAAVVSIVVALVQMPAASATFADRLSVGFSSLSPAAWEPQAWVLLAAIVVVPTFIAVVLYLQGIRGLGPSQAAVISTLEPLFTIALARVVLNEQLVAVQWLGAILVLGGVVFAEISARKIEQPAAF